jgi:hypothetical protein
LLVIDTMLLYSTLSTEEANNNQETLDDNAGSVDEGHGESPAQVDVGVEQGDVGLTSLADNPVLQTVHAEDLVDSFASEDNVEVTVGNGDVEPGETRQQGNHEQVVSVEISSGDDVEDNSPKIDAEPAGGKSRKQSKKNRNVKGVLGTLKNKLENIQKDNGGQPNYLLLVEDNFTDLNVTGPKTKTNRKILVTAAGDLKNLFMEKNIVYNPERMLVLKEGRKLEPDYSFLDQYISAQLRRTSPITSSAVSSPGDALNSPITSSAVSSPGDALNASVVGFLKSLSSGRKPGRKTGKKKRKRSRSTTESSSEDSDESDTSGESRKHKRKSKKKRRRQNIRKSQKKVQESSSGTSDSNLDDNSETSSDEDDDDPTHGTTQNSKFNKTKPKKKTRRHPNARKEKHDILAPKKVHTPGSPDIFATGFGKSAASKKKPKSTADQLKVLAEKPKAPPTKPNAPAAKSRAPTAKSRAPASKPKTQVQNPKVPGDKPKAPAVKSKPQNRPKAVSNKQKPTIPDPINTTEGPAQRAQPKQAATQSEIPAELSENRASPTDADVNKDDSLQTLPPSDKVASWLLASDGRSEIGTSKPQQPLTWKKPDPKSKENGKNVSKPNLLAPTVTVNSKVTNDDPKPGPSGQFKFGRAAKLVQASKNVAKKLFKDSLMTEEEIEEYLDMDKTPTRKKRN